MRTDLPFVSKHSMVFWFLLRDAMLSAVYAVVVCLCVCVCVCHTPVLYQMGLPPLYKIRGISTAKCTQKSTI